MKVHGHVDENWWWSVARRCEYATFFHTPLWHRLAVETYPHCIDKTMGFELGNGVCGVLPVLETGRRLRGIFRYFTSTFAGCYGDLIADGPVSPDDRDRIYRSFLHRNVGELLVTENPLAPGLGDTLCRSISNDFTHILPLYGGYEALFARFSKGHRSSTSKGRRAGVRALVASSIGQFGSYYCAYEDSLRRWGSRATSTYPSSLFEGLFRVSREYPEQIKLWLAELGGEILAGAVVFYWNHHVVYWHGAGYEKYFEYCPTNVLLASVIQDACTRGFTYFDFNPSGGHEGVERFKSRFGAHKIDLRRRGYHSKLSHALVPLISLSDRFINR